MKSPDDAFRISWIKKFIASSFNSTVSLTIVKRPLLIMVLISLLTSFLILSEAAISHLFCITCPVATVVSSIPSPLMVSYCKKALFFHRQCFNMAPSIPNTSWSLSFISSKFKETKALASLSWSLHKFEAFSWKYANSPPSNWPLYLFISPTLLLNSLINLADPKPLNRWYSTKFFL